MRYGIDGRRAPAPQRDRPRARDHRAERVKRQIENAALRRLAEVRELQGVEVAAERRRAQA